MGTAEPHIVAAAMLVLSETCELYLFINREPDDRIAHPFHYGVVDPQTLQCLS